jgi:hypothetical protein
MVPPHGVCSIAALDGCLRSGFDAVCADWPYWWLTEPSATSALAGWAPLDRLAGLPLIPRIHAVAGNLDDLVFRAFLGQPLVLYAHHTDLSSGLDVLATRAHDVRTLGVEIWQSLGGLAGDAVSTYRSGDSMMLTLHSRRAVVAIPDGVSQVQVRVPGAEPANTELRLEIEDADGVRVLVAGEQVPVRPGELRVATAGPSPLPRQRSALPIRAMLRRVLTESRDRAAPLVSKVRRSARAQSAS